jgi:hypothetical protein
MGYLIKWDNDEKTVVLQQYTDNPVKDDLYHLAQESAAMLNTVSHTVHLIIDERTSKLTLSSSDIKFLEKNVPTNQGTVVMVVSKSGQSYKKLMQNVGKTLAPNAFKQNFFVTTVEEARQLLQEQFGVNYPQSALTDFG